MEQTENQTQVKTLSAVNQKVLLVLAVIGLIGFGFMAAAISQVTVEKETLEASATTYSFIADSEQDLKNQMYEKADDMGFTTAQIDTALEEFEDETGGDTEALSWGGNPFTCAGCGVESKGTCMLGACWGGHIKYDDYAIHVTIAF